MSSEAADPEDLVDLPPVLAAIAEAAGAEAAQLISRAHGGTRVLIPQQPGRNWLTGLVGAERAAAIIEALGPTRLIDVPLGPGARYFSGRRELLRRFVELERSGARERDIARALGVTGRTVRNLRRHRRERRQGDLFD